MANSRREEICLNAFFNYLNINELLCYIFKLSWTSVYCIAINSNKLETKEQSISFFGTKSWKGRGKGRRVPLKTEKPAPFMVQAFRCGWAANYFPTCHRSIIVAAGLNFSVRNGKRCAPAQWPPLSSLPASTGWVKTDTRTTPHGVHGTPDGSVRAISAARLNVSPRSHLRPIDVVVSDGPPRRPHLGAGFALRCVQRLSRPDAATRPCAWRRNRLTVGPSDPVLSY